jgi:hypothetical protein
VRQDGLALAGLSGPIVGGDVLVLGGEQLDGARAAADPQRLSDQPIRRRVVAAFEDDLAVAIQGGLLPDGQVVRRTRQRPER